MGRRAAIALDDGQHPGDKWIIHGGMVGGLAHHHLARAGATLEAATGFMWQNSSSSLLLSKTRS
jgi:hypothetical protein